MNNKQELIKQVVETSQFFEIRVIIKLFGKVIIDYTYPPKKS